MRFRQEADNCVLMSEGPVNRLCCLWHQTDSVRSLRAKVLCLLLGPFPRHPAGMVVKAKVAGRAIRSGLQDVGTNAQRNSWPGRWLVSPSDINWPLDQFLRNSRGHQNAGCHATQRPTPLISPPGEAVWSEARVGSDVTDVVAIALYGSLGDGS